jgi:PAS domain S-box-containing protein
MCQMRVSPARRRIAPRNDRRLADTDLRRLVDRAPDVVFRYRLDPPGYEFISRAIVKIAGYTPEELYADPASAFRIVHPNDRQLIRDALARGSGRLPLLLRWLRKDESVVWVEQRSRPLYGHAGELLAVEGVAREIADPLNGQRPSLRVVDAVRIDFACARALVSGRDAQLTPSEFRLLVLLTDQPGRIVDRETMIEALWDSRVAASPRACEVHVSKLRAKLEQDSHAPRIEAIRGKGYRFIPCG